VDFENEYHDGEIELIVDLFKVLREELGDDYYLIATLFGVRKIEDVYPFKWALKYLDYV